MRNRRNNRRPALAGAAMIGAALVALGSAFGMAAAVDAKRGLSVSESLASAGFGSAAEADAARTKLAATALPLDGGIRAPYRREDAAAVESIMADTAARLRARGCSVRRIGAALYRLDSCK